MAEFNNCISMIKVDGDDNDYFDENGDVDNDVMTMVMTMVTTRLTGLCLRCLCTRVTAWTPSTMTPLAGER